MQLTTASSETEAAVICGLLSSRGIEATYDKGGLFQPLSGIAGGTGAAYLGRQEILVHTGDLEQARRVLAEVER